VRYLDQDKNPISEFSEPTPFQVHRWEAPTESVPILSQEKVEEEKRIQEEKELRAIKTTTISAPAEDGGGAMEVFSPQPKSIKQALKKMAQVARDGERSPSSDKNTKRVKAVSDAQKKALLKKELFKQPTKSEMDFSY